MRHEKVSGHFGRSDAVLVYSVDPESRTFARRKQVNLRSATCESIPRRLQALDVRVVLARLAGAGARASLSAKGIELISGWGETDPDALLAQYVAGERPAAEGRCDDNNHEHHHRRRHRSRRDCQSE